MKRSLGSLIAIFLGLTAMLLCVSAPVQAQTSDLHEMAGMPADMPCHPQSSAVVFKACDLQCPVLVASEPVFVYIQYAKKALFVTDRPVHTGVTSDPEAPPPR